MNVAANQPGRRRGNVFISIVIGATTLVATLVLLVFFEHRTSQFNAVPDSPAIQGEAMLMAFAVWPLMCIIGSANLIGILLAARGPRAALPSTEKRVAPIAIALNLLPWLTFCLAISWPPLLQF